MRSDRNSLYILVVENDDIYRRWLSFALRQADYHVEACGDYEEASELVGDEQRSIDLMLLDLWQPFQSAYDWSQRLLEQRPEAKLLFMSVQTRDQLDLEGVVVEEDMFLQKPCPRQDLLSKLRELL